MSPKPRLPKPVIGWREWVAFPELGIDAIKAKIDTGARTSALHAFDVQRFSRGGKRMVRFKIHPLQRDSHRTIEASARLVDERTVKSSGGHEQTRLVIVTRVQFNGEFWPIEVTLTSRDEMGFRMLLGRQAIRGRFSVDPGRSFLGGIPAGVRRKQKKKKTKLKKKKTGLKKKAKKHISS